MINITHLSKPLEYAKLANIEYGWANLDDYGMQDKFKKIDEKSKKFDRIVGAFNTWKVSLYRNKDTDEYIVIFRGTNFKSKSISNWVQNLRFFLKKDKKVLDFMNESVDGFRDKIGKDINTFVGHSAGGYLATYVKKDWKCYRVTFNGLHCLKKPLNQNIRTHGDIVSSKYVLSIKSNYVTIGGYDPKGHSLDVVMTYLLDLDWNQIYPGRFSPREIRLFQRQRSPNHSPMSRSSRSRPRDFHYFDASRSRESSIFRNSSRQPSISRRSPRSRNLSRSRNSSREESQSRESSRE